MSEQTLTLLDAIRLAKEAEQQASVLYGNAAQEATNPLVRRLFEQLAAFEELHYEKLLDLETSLRDKGAFIKYEGREELAVPAQGEVERIEGVKKTSGAKVIRQAMDIERAAEERYDALAEQTVDPDGIKMFKRLAKEERNHYLVLERAYYDLSNFRLPV